MQQAFSSDTYTLLSGGQAQSFPERPQQLSSCAYSITPRERFARDSRMLARAQREVLEWTVSTLQLHRPGDEA